ncbi:unnamed protein product [Durusdinium trenchii]|uniref:Uncharacterized protein n=1 Tax=Durusdinium trenchii TaxID=1381693 RepID=A0ABP0LBU4_9DINO
MYPQGGGQYIAPGYSNQAYPVFQGGHEPRFPGGTGYATPFTNAVQRSGSNPELAGDYQELFKFIIIGDEAVGKTCLLLQFTDKRYRTTHQVTVGVEFGSRTVEVAGCRVKLQCWDTAGQDRFRSIIRSYYRGAAGMLLVYDISQRDSFDHILQWLKEAKDNADPDLVITLIGNKADKERERQVRYDEGKMLARSHGLLFMETSAVTGQSVDDAFLSTAKHVLVKQQKRHQGEMQNPMVTHGQEGYYSNNMDYASLRSHQPGYMQTLKLTPGGPVHSGGAPPPADSCCG